MPVSRSYTPAAVHPLLGDGFADLVRPAAFPKLTLRFRNQPWAERVGLGALSGDEWAAHFARFEALPDNIPAPLALRYHGHQFHQYNQQLGDGRGFLFAQLRDPVTAELLDLATKGSGKTPYSRGGDGRLTLKGGVREILATEMLEARGVRTSKTFSLFETGESLVRHDEPSPTRASVLVRLSRSHVRFGTFQRLAHERRADLIEKLLGHVAEHHLPELRDARDLPNAFLRVVRDRTADLCASWLAAGFVHGVLNTDNLVVTGESFDYGPWRFLPHLDPDFTAAYFDEGGLYAYGRQGRAVLWNLVRLSETLTPLLSGVRAEPVMRDFEPLLRERLAARWLARLGVRPRDADHDAALLDVSSAYLERTRVDFDRFFHDWYGGLSRRAIALDGPARARWEATDFAPVLHALEGYEPTAVAHRSHPLLSTHDTCSMTIDEVEALWARVAAVDDWTPLQAKIDRVRAYGAALGNAATAGVPGR